MWPNYAHSPKAPFAPAPPRKGVNFMADNGTKAYVTFLPKCDFHDRQHDAKYDFKTQPLGPFKGSWGNGCEDAFLKNGIGLGLGLGQELIVESNS